MQHRSRYGRLVGFVTALAGLVLLAAFGAGPRAAAAGQAHGSARVVGDDDVKRYVEVRQFAQEKDPGLATLLRSPDIDADRPRLEPSLEAVGMTFDRFAEIHRFVLAHPELRASVEAQLARTGVGPASGEASMSGAPAASPSASPR